MSLHGNRACAERAFQLRFIEIRDSLDSSDPARADFEDLAIRIEPYIGSYRVGNGLRLLELNDGE